MDDLDFTIPPGKLTCAPAGKSTYDAALSLEFFKSAGREESIGAGEIIFSENEKANGFLLQRNKMYLLLEGEVDIKVKGAPVSAIRSGEIFGEMAAITNTPRSATATAKSKCSIIALDDKQLQVALRKKPEFALMLMSVMSERLRKMLARLDANGALLESDEVKKYRLLDKKLLAYLAGEIDDRARMRYERSKVIMQEGQSGVLMYVLLDGSVAISMQNNVVEKIGPGGIFGEMALIEGTKRLASAIAETDCSLLAINRSVFLDLVKDNPEFGIALLGMVGDRVRFIASRHRL